MPVFFQPLPGPTPKQPNVEATPKPYKHSLVDSKKQPVETLSAYIGGSPWRVDYYSQVLGSHEALKAFDPNQLTVYQQYRRISNLEIKLQGALNPADEQDVGRMNISGNAIIPPIPGFIPNVHDAFIADGGEGRAIQFTITNIQQKSFQQGTAWDIDFVAARLATESIVKKIDAKVVESLHYVKDRHTLGLNPLLIDEDYNIVQKLNRDLKDVTAHWLSTNYSHSFKTVLVPGQGKQVYDPYVTRAILSLVSSDEHPIMRDIKAYNCDDYRIPKYTDIYQALMQRDKSMLYRTFKGYQLVEVRKIKASALQNTIRYSGIDYIVTPNSKNLDSDDYDALKDLDSTVKLKGGRDGGVATEDKFICYADPTIPCEFPPKKLSTSSRYYDINGNAIEKGFDIPVVPNNTYALSTLFYDKTLDDITLFEKLCLDCIEEQPVNAHDVAAFADAFYKWNRIEQYYLGPILIILIRAALRGIS